MSPRGRPLDQARVGDLAPVPGVLIVAGRFEGVDERVIEGRGLEEVSVGDYVLSGGEIAAMALLDAVVRLLPGVMGNADSGASESFADGLLEYPQYTRPQVWEGRAIPEVLLSGDHGRIAAWRRGEAEATDRRAPPGSRLHGGNRQSRAIRVWNRPVSNRCGGLAENGARAPAFAVPGKALPMNIIQQLEKEQADAIAGPARSRNSRRATPSASTSR